MLRWVDRWTRRQRAIAALIATLVGVTLPFAEILVGTKSGLYFDIITAHLPRYSAAWDNWRRGLSPNWWRSIFGGFNALGAGQSGAYYIPNALFAWVSRPLAYRMWFFLHLWLMAAGWFAWSWRRWGSLLGAFVSGIGGTLSGYVVYHVLFMPYTASLTLLPWVLLALDQVIERRERRYVAFLALLLGGLSFTGHPQMLWLTLVALGVLAASQLLRRPFPLRACSRVAGAVALGLAVGALQLIPLLRFSKSSTRPSLDKAGAFEYSAAPRHLLTLVFPNILGGGNGGLGWNSPWLGGSLQHEVANYLGITMLALAVVGAVHQRRNRAVMGCIVLAVLGLLTSIGGSTPVGTAAYHLLPFADHFRAWARNGVWVNIAVALLAGAGARQFKRTPRKTAAQLLAASLVLAVFALILPAFHGLRNDLAQGGEGFAARIMPVLFLASLGTGVLLSSRWRQAATLCIGLLCLLDLGLFAFAAPWRSNSLPTQAADKLFRATRPPFGDAVDDPGGIDRWVSDIADASALWPRILAIPSDTVNGYDPLIQADYSNTFGYMAYNGYLPDPRLWSGGWMPDVLRTTTLLASGYAGSPAPGWTPYGTFDIYTLYSYVPRLPESYLVGGVRVGSLDDARFALGAPDTDLTQYAYVDRSTVSEVGLYEIAAAHEPGPSGSVLDGAMDDGGSGTWTVFADRPSLFVTSYAWMEGWTATVDGRPVPVARTNALVLGVPVPAGSHRVHLRFTPPGWTTGRNLSIVALVIVALLFLSDVRRERWMLLVRRVDRDRHRVGSVPDHGTVDHAEHGEEGRLADR